MADKALYVVGQKRFVQTMRKAGADMQEVALLTESVD